MIDSKLLFPFFETSERLITFLKSCSLLNGLSQNDFDLLLSKASILKIKSGQYLCDYSSKPSCVYVLLHGRLNRSHETFFHENASFYITPSESIGEIDLLSSAAKPISIVAIRDSILLEIPKSLFMTLLQQSSNLLQNTCHIIAKKLHSHFSNIEKNQAVSTFAIIPTDNKSASLETGKKIKQALLAFGKTLLINSKTVKELNSSEENFLSKYIAEAEATHKYIILESDPFLSSWTKFCLKSVDRILFLISKKEDENLTSVEKYGLFEPNIFAEKDLLFIYENNERPKNTSKFLKERKNINHYHVNITNSKDFERIARVITKRAVGLVLSGGGAKGIAQIGILRVLVENNFPIDFIGGTSIGSVVAALHALNFHKEQLKEIGYDIFIKDKGIIDPTFPLHAFIKGKKIEKKLLKYASIDIEDLPIPYFAISTNLTKRKQHIHRFGSLSHAIRLSIAIPGIFPPCWDNNDVFVDGGIFNIFPVDVMDEYLDVDQIIGIDTSSNLESFLSFPSTRSKSGLSLLKEKFFHNKNIFPTICPILSRMTELKGQAKKEQLIEKEILNIYIRPPIDNFHTLAFDSFEKIEEIGYIFAKKNISDWKAKLWH